MCQIPREELLLLLSFPYAAIWAGYPGVMNRVNIIKMDLRVPDAGLPAISSQRDGQTASALEDMFYF